MNAAFLDTSCLVAVAFGETGAQKVVQVLEQFDRILAANVLEAERRAALPDSMTFLSLDTRQRAAAGRLGFQTTVLP